MCNTHNGNPEEKKLEKRTKEIFETIVTKNFPQTNTEPQIQEIQRTLSNISPIPTAPPLSTTTKNNKS